MLRTRILNQEPDCGTCDDDGYYFITGQRYICGCEAGKRYQKISGQTHWPIHTPIPNK